METVDKAQQRGNVDKAQQRGEKWTLWSIMEKVDIAQQR